MMFRSVRQTSQNAYSRLCEESHDLVDGTEHMKKEHRGNHSYTDPWLLLGLSVLTNVLAVSLAMVVYYAQSTATHSAWETGLPTELNLATSQIEVVRTSLDPSNDISKYFGPPDAEVDRAWARLESGVNLDIPAVEADLDGKTIKWPNSENMFTGLQVYHGLHCVNRIRQSFYPEYYVHVFNHTGAPPVESHIWHCLNLLRLQLQCGADLTPMEWEVGLDRRIVLKGDTMRTCRNFDKINDWSMARMSKYDEILRNGTWVLTDGQQSNYVR